MLPFFYCTGIEVRKKVNIAITSIIKSKCDIIFVRLLEKLKYG